MKVKIWLAPNGQRIQADIPWAGGQGPVMAKKVSGARWAKSAKCWTYPLDIGTCRDLREVFGKSMEVSQDLADWAREAIKAEQLQLDLRSATDSELKWVPKYAPVLAEAMANRTYQRVGTKFIVNGRNVLIADEPGTGKTLETLGALVETGARTVLVFAKKKAVLNVWAAESKRWLGDLCEVYPMVGTAKQRQEVISRYLCEAFDSPNKISILIGNIEMIRWQKPDEGKTTSPKFPDLFRPLWDAVIVDESHKALIGRHTMSDSITQTRYGMMKLKVNPDRGLRVALSGTPFRGKVRNLWGTLNFLDSQKFSSYWRFCEKYFEVTETRWAKEVGDLRPEMTEQFDRDMAPYILRRTKAEVAPEMPPKQYGGTPLDPMDPQSTIGIWLDMEPKQAKLYKEIKEDGWLRVESGGITVNGILAELTRLRQFATCAWDVDAEGTLIPVKPSAKYDWLVEFIEERRESGTKVVVASQFTKVVNAFARWLADDGIASYTVTGETSQRQVDERVNAFNDPADEVPVMLINTLAGGESINLDACADDLVFIDETHIPDDQEQAENRIHRMSRIHQVNIWYLRSKGTIEEEICRITASREGKTKDRLDGSRGVEVLRKLMEA